jgi:alpha-glucosidase
MFGPEVLDITRARLGDRERLLPYLYALADEAARTGAPILRPLVWEFPDDPAVADLGDEAMIGPYILAAPIMQEGAMSRSVYLPAGRWYELHSDAIIDGPTTIDVPVTLAALPLYVRAGAILPVAGGGLELYPGPPTTFTLYEDDGEALAGGTRVTLELTALPDGAQLVSTDHQRSFVVRVHRVDGEVTGVDGATAFTRDAATRILEAAGAGTLRFRYDPAIGELAPPVPVTFEVNVPADTPMSTQIHVATSSTGWTHMPLTRISPTVARGAVELPRGAWFDYKYTRGGWETVEKLGNCGEANNRYRFAAPESQVDSVATWRDRCGN